MTDFTLTSGADVFPSMGEDISGSDRIFGLGGADQIHGGAGADAINGGADADTLFGDAGNDTLDAGILPLNDVLDGGANFDLVILDYQNVINVVTNVSVRVVANFSTGSWATLIDGVTGATVMNFEHITITSGNAADSIVGGVGNDTLTSLGGTDKLYGGDGNDDIAKTYGVYDLRGGAGSDLLRVAGVDTKQPGMALMFDARGAVGTITCGTTTSGSFRAFERYAISGTAGRDVVHLDDGADIATGGTGADLLDGLGGRDTLDGGAGLDTLYGGGGDDALSTGEPRQSIAALAEQVFGGAGNDAITTGVGFGLGPVRTFAGLRIDGGSGTDSLEIGGNTEVMDLRGAVLSGIEALTYASSGFLGGVIVTAGQFNMFDDYTLNGFVQVVTSGDLVANGDLFITEIKLFTGGQKIDLSASTKPFSDFGPRVTGGAGADTMVGSARGDYFTGDAGNDTMRGGAGADGLVGGLGADRLTGGTGADTFVFGVVADSTVALRDVITDFTVNAAAGVAFIDKLNLSLIDAKAGTVANDAFTFVGGAAFSAVGQVRAVQSGADTLVQVNTAGAGGAEMVVVLQGFQATSLTAADFWL